MSFPSKISAITFSKTGDYDVIEKTEVPFPKVEPNHIVVKVAYAGVNFIDTYYRKGLYPVTEVPYIVGQEASGTIVQLPTNEAILDNPGFKARGYKIGSKVVTFANSAFAEYMSVPWERVSPLPDILPLNTAAAALTQGSTAIAFMNESYKVKAGDTILVHTVAGGLGLIFAQYAKLRGATVIGTTSTEAKAELAKRSGADHVILYTKENTVDRVLELTGGVGVDAIFDGVGKDTFENNFKMIKRKGTIVSVGNASGAVPPFSPMKLVEKNVALLRPTLGNYLVTPQEAGAILGEVYTLAAQGKLKFHIYNEYPFTAEGTQQAQKDLVGGKTTGKLLVKINSE